MNENEKWFAITAIALSIFLLVMGIAGIGISHIENLQLPEIPSTPSLMAHAILSWLSQGDTGLKITIIALLGLLILSLSAFLIMLVIFLRTKKELTQENIEK